MHAAVLTSPSLDMKMHLEKIEIQEIPIPTPAGGEVLVQVRGSSVDPVDWELIESPLELLWHYPRQMGFDISGVVIALGSNVKRIKLGDEVWGQMGTLSEAASGGTAWAEYAVVPEEVLAIKPQSLNFTQAGALPMVRLTGLDSLTWAADKNTNRLDNMTVVVLGGSGGTGHVGIQMAKAMGAKEVITTCGTSHIDFVKSIGADRVIDYHKQNWTDVLPDQSVDIVYDCVGIPKTGDQAFPKLREGGKYVTLQKRSLATVASELKRPDVKQYSPLCIINCVHHEKLEQVGKMVDAGHLHVHLDQIFGFSDIRMAVNHSISGHSTGKSAIAISQSSTTHIPQQTIII
eukprot:gnl/MRDRNA2_/MRDRNA2_132770_c0_seq1.p1 gnl/MRDRNA2_/MRDRNA2_132770_c0~~gnl/MRDRNA2_/MRDRNA2_132770_c0_seq1.p1  ORF type:complete len:397 (+),score=70.01 gnl/MRDRNA2_/MRDRNA2_132770_c0_seq1:155-1192(+)